MYGMNEAQRAQFEVQKQKLEKLKVEAENLMKRLRGEEIPSDKEVEGDLDQVPSKFETEHGLQPERVDELVELLLAAVEPDLLEKETFARQLVTTLAEPPAPRPASVRGPETAEEYIEYMKKRGLWR